MKKLKLTILLLSYTRKMEKLQLIVLFFSLNYTLLAGSPSMEPCPSDSSIVEGICKCNPEQCSKPPCLYTLNLANNGSDIPGDCCPTYTCDNCSNDTLIDNKCPCAVGAVLNSRAKCECVDPEKSIENGTCVCNPNLCPLPDICDDKSVRVLLNEGCCSKTKCIRCPEDSFPLKPINDSIEDLCVCYPCETECGVNQTVVTKRHGKNIPGHCCDFYDCVDISKSCLVNETAYHEGETWQTNDKQICKCQNGIALCNKSTANEILHACIVDDMIYKQNETWFQDLCTACTCIDGKIKCIAHMCDVNISQVNKIDCQPLTNCKKTCPNGFKVNKKGCETCKCNPINYSKIFEHYLQDKFNLTVDELTEILKNNKEVSNVLLTSTTTSTTTSSTTPTTSSTTTTSTTSTQHPPTTTTTEKIPNLDISKYGLYIALVVICGFVITVVSLSFFIFRIHRKTASYDTSSTNMYEPITMKLNKNKNKNIIKDTSTIKLYDKQ